MRYVLIVYKAHTEAARRQAEQLGRWLEHRGITANLVEGTSAAPGAAPGPTLKLPERADLVVVLGGDGTMLGAVREIVLAGLTQAPILGINLGGLGFLTALAPEELLPAMELILNGEFTTSRRLMLEASVLRQGHQELRFSALNDVVINKAALARIVELETEVNGRVLTTFRADGLIVATPTGSTAYNLSAGGPICHPDLDCIALAPICSFALSNRPLLIRPDMTLTIKLGPRTGETTLTMDGQVGFSLQPSDQITVARAQCGVEMIRSPFKDYFEILRTKLRWG